MSKFVLVPWPECQSIMEFPWFEEECFLADNSAYLVPEERIREIESDPDYYNEVDGDLISLAKEGKFDVIAHGCNCFCTMGAGIAPQMARAFGCDKFEMELPQYRGSINKLGTIDYNFVEVIGRKNPIYVVNAYTQYHYGKNHIDGVSSPVDYEAITMCMRKMNFIFKDKHIGLPKIGAGLAGGDWNIIKRIIQKELFNCKVTIVNYVPKGR